MKEEIISLKTAMLAKEKGFDVPTLLCYDDRDNTPLPFNEGNELYQNHLLLYYSAPTQSLLQKWLREKHNFHISISTFRSKLWGFSIWNMKENHFESEALEYKSFEECLEKALFNSLEEIK